MSVTVLPSILFLILSLADDPEPTACMIMSPKYMVDPVTNNLFHCLRGLPRSKVPSVFGMRLSLTATAEESPDCIKLVSMVSALMVPATFNPSLI